ncbi:hypothetical protein [Hymenobacter persicinus]|uniref:Uncharacterized protein n=1 Tax=Hymenobacter persicinus TaxID=2025506 RepID=A0A4V1ZBA8_9BACT|nr:hypothetical protein [Hymenobacter persicinus]RYU84433.1 hypothetical protein EWM57_01720 [Hymenobacter persicinus]
MEEAARIRDYLPRRFKNEREQEYINALWQAFEQNYLAGQYQFALLAYHMLFMSCVYCAIWQIKGNRKVLLENALILHQDEDKILNASSPFNFSEMQERAVFSLLRLVNCERQHIGKLKKLVDDRNNMAHANGNIYYTSEALANSKTREVLALLDIIHDLMRPVVQECFKQFLLNSHDPELREYPMEEDQIQEVLIYTNYFSPNNEEACLNFDLEPLRTHEHFDNMQSLFDKFCTIHADY